METQLMLTISVDALKVYRATLRETHTILHGSDSRTPPHYHEAAAKVASVINLLTQDIEAAEQPPIAATFPPSYPSDGQD